MANKAAAELKHHIQQNIDLKKSYVFVDLATMRFSAQKLIEFIVNESAPFVYWGVYGQLWKTRQNYASIFKQQKRDVNAFSHNWDFIEFLITSNENPVVGVRDNKPVFKKNVNPKEVMRH